MNEVGKYLNNLEPEQKQALERIRNIVKATTPDAVELISYDMPGFKYKGKYLVGYAAFRDHLSIFPTPGPIAVLADKLRDFRISKGTVQFTADQPLSEELIRKIIQIRANDIDNIRD